MSLVNHSVSNLINGVSQQSPAIRLDNQLEEQINCFSDVTKGLGIRNGIELSNVIAQDLDATNIIEFTLDGEKIVLSLDAAAGTPLVHIPMTADIATLSTSVPNLSYFEELQKGDIRVLEDKDKVYILNTAKQVGEVELGRSYVDVIISNTTQGRVDNNWTVGEYELLISAVNDPSAAAATATKTITVTRATTLTDITTAINSDAALILETGTCFITGEISNFRITFSSIPNNFIAPTVVATNTVAMTATTTEKIEDSDFVYSYPQSYVLAYNSTWTNRYYWEGSFVVQVDSNTARSGVWYYERGSLVGATSALNYLYKIRRYKYGTVVSNYSAKIDTPIVTFTSNTLADHSQEAMIWISGVTSNQTYDVRIKYHLVGTPNVPLYAPTSSTYYNTSVGTTVSNIKLNWVAGDMSGKIAAHAHFTTTQYENAIHVVATGDYIIEEIIATNSFDNSSMSAAIKASTNSTSGILNIETLPPTFVEGFKVRVGDENAVDSNYYLSYSTDFKGWKESGLDSNRALDYLTMPHIIDKDKIRKTGIVTIESETWVKASAGDNNSNKSPSFTDKNIKDMFFYGSRLGLATDDTLTMSAIGETDTFYRTTASQTVISDRVDIKLDSSKVGFDTIKHVTTFNQKLFINTGTTQSVLKVNTAFDLTSARLSEVSSYSLGTGKPLPAESGLYFAVSDDEFTNVINYQATGENTFDIEDLTKHCPTYIEGTVDKMIYSKNLTVITVNENSKIMYVQNRFSRGGEMLQNSWSKWVLPYDVKHMFFFNDELNVIMTTVVSAVDYVVTGKYNLKPQDIRVANADAAEINWTPFLDIYSTSKTLIETFPDFIGINSKTGVKYDTVADAYAATLVNQIELGTETAEFYDLVSPVYYWLTVGDLNTVVFNDGTAINFGNNTLTEFDSGGYRYFKGTDEGSGYFGVSRATVTASSFYEDNMVYGIPFTATIELSKIIPRVQGPNGPTVMNYAQLMLRRMRLYLSNSGPFRVSVDFANRMDYSLSYNGPILGGLVIGNSEATDTTFQFPINGKSNLVSITIVTDSSTPFNLLSTEWQGNMVTKGRNI